jgi:tetratricopeptide (TPR) repeat protein
VLAFQAQHVSYQAEFALPLRLRLLNAGLAYAWYLFKTVWPTGLAPLYTRPHHLFPVAGAVAAWLLVLAVTAAAVWQARRRPYLAVGWLWFVGTLVPVIGLVQVGVQTWADRYTYVPHFGLFVALVWGLADLLRDRVAAPVWAAGAAAVLLACLLATRAQADLWRDNVALWQHAVAVTDHNYGAHFQLGYSLVAADRLAEAEEQFRLAIKAEPRHTADGYYQIGQVQALRGRWAEAADWYAKSVRLDPGLAPSQRELGKSRVKIGDMGGAVAPLREAVRLDPADAVGHFLLATALLHRGPAAEAVREADAVLQLDPASLQARGLRGLALAVAGRPAEAEADFRAAVLFDPGAAYFLGWCLNAAGRPDAAREQYRAAGPVTPAWSAGARREAWRLATDPDPLRRSGPLALLWAQVLNQALGERDPAALDALAAALAECGRFDEAGAAARKAQGLASGELAEQIGRRLKLYEAHKPFHEGEPAA